MKPSAATVASTASNAFGIELYRALAAAGPDRNLFVSPYSISVAMTMAAEGASGETEAELARVLRFPSGTGSGPRAIVSVHDGYAALAKRFLEAAGSSDPALREKVAALQTRLQAAKDETRSLMRSSDWEKLKEAGDREKALADEINALAPQLDRFDLRVVNALWVERTFSLLPTYVKTVDRYYGSGGVNQVDFMRDAEGARKAINTWVEDHTENRIKDLLPSGTLNSATRLVIANAVYFKGQWAEPFEESRSADGDFLLAGGDSVQTRLMNHPWRKSVPYAAFNADGSLFNTPEQVPADAKAPQPQTYPADGGFAMIELPYKGGDLSMVVVAPRSPGGLRALEQAMSADALSGWLADLKRRTVHTTIPRFKLESEFNLKQTLEQMGVRRAFISPDQPGGAQFTGMSSSEDPTQQLFIGGVRHKAWVEVTEKGTEAAAATALDMRAGSAARPPEMVPFIPTFRADRPFLFLIRDGGTGLVLFVGRYTGPSN